MEHRLWSSPERGHRKETIKKKKTCVLNILTSGLNQIKWNLWSTLFPECVITSMDILTRTWSPCCSGTSLPHYQVTTCLPQSWAAEGCPAQEPERVEEDSARQPLGRCVSLYGSLKTSSALAPLGNEGSFCDERCGSWSAWCFIELV